MKKMPEKSLLTITPEELITLVEQIEALPDKEKYLAYTNLNLKFQEESGRFFGATEPFQAKYFFKRWHNIQGNGAGAEFRPLLTADYGYPDEQMTATSWVIWAAQMFGNYQLGASRFFCCLAGAMFVNDFILPQFLPTLVGSSFVWNVQLGLNTYNYLFGKNYNLTRNSCFLGLGGDVGIMFVENNRGFKFGEQVAHSVHGAGLAFGMLFGYISRKW
jgi:hypothetical protein